MPVTEFQLYASSDLSFSGGTVTLSAAHDGSNNVALTVDDDDDVLEGDLSRNEQGNDTNQFGTATFPDGSSVGGGSATVYSEEQYTLTAPDGSTITLYRIEIDTNASPFVGTGTLVGYLPSSPMQPGVSYTRDTSNTLPGNSPDYADIDGAICLSADSLILCPDGLRAVDSLSAGDLVMTKDDGPQAIRWVGARKYDSIDFAQNAKLRPVRITAGTLGEGLPDRDLLVSRQHRMLVSSKIAARMFGSSDVLISAIRLTECPGIYVDHDVTEVEYFHLLFDRHQVIFAEGAPTESMYTGPEAMKTVSDEARAEILEIFPQLIEYDYSAPAARPIPSNAQQRKLVTRHVTKNMSLLAADTSGLPSDQTVTSA